MPSKRFGKDKKTLYISLIAISLLSALLMIISPTRSFLVGILGWAVCVYIPITFIVGVLLSFGKKVSIDKKQAIVYAALFLMFTATLHILFAKALIEGKESYILAPIQGQDTVGGMLMSLVTAPIKLLCGNHYGVILTVFFLLTATVCFFAIYPFIAKDGKKPTKKIKNTVKDSSKRLFVDNTQDIAATEDYDESEIVQYEPKNPYDRPDFKKLDSEEKLFNIFRGQKTIDEAFNTPKEPERKPFEGLGRFESKRENVERYNANEEVKPRFDEKFVKKFGNRTVEEEYEIRYGSMPVYNQKSADDGINKVESVDYVNKPDIIIDSPNYFEAEPVIPKEAYNEPPQRNKKADLDYINKPISEEEYIGLFDFKDRVAKPPSVKIGETVTVDRSKVPPYTKPVQVDMFKPKEKPVEVVSQKSKHYIAPPLELLSVYQKRTSDFPIDYNITKDIIEQTLLNSNIVAEVITARQGPSFTRYEIKLENAQNISKVAGMGNIFEMCLERENIAIHAPIKGKNAVGLDIPNRERDVVGLHSVIASAEFMNPKGGVQIALGKDLEGKPVVGDLAKLYHLLVAGATGTGKSVFINSLIMSIIYKHSPEDVRLLLIDPKKVELSVYQNLPNLLIGETVKELDQVMALLKWLTQEMDSRYSFLDSVGCNELDMYNNTVRDKQTEPKIPRIILVVDEMADLMLKSKGQVEDYIIRIAQLGRACGIHLVLATQRPTANVITGLISANIIPRAAFAVKKNLDSRIILDEGGAEKLLGKGDMIFSYNSATRLQAPYVDMNEIRSVCNFIKTHNEAVFDENLTQILKNLPKEQAQEEKLPAFVTPKETNAEKDADFESTLRRILKTFIIEKKASISSAQTRNGIGYIKAKKIVETLTDRGYISKEDGMKPREVLITLEEFHEEFGESE